MVYYLSGGNRRVKTVAVVKSIEEAKIVGYRLASSHPDWEIIFVHKRPVEDIVKLDLIGGEYCYAVATIERQPNNKYGSIMWCNQHNGIDYYLFRDGSTVRQESYIYY